MDQFKSRLAWLFLRYQQGDCTEEERIEFLDLVTKEDNHAELNNLLKTAISETNPDQILDPAKADQIYDSIISHREMEGPNRNVTKKLYIKRLAVAAAVILVIGLSIFRMLPATDRKTAAVQDTNSISKITEPATDRAILTRPPSFATLNGEKKLVTLPDGTKIHLNAASSLSIDPDFYKKNRIVYLSGEALFDVTHDTHLPFIVRINNYDVKVLGTLFNVKAYEGERISETTLLRGSVQIIKNDGGTLTLVPNQKVIFKNIDSTHIIKNDMIGHPMLTSQKIVPVSFSEQKGEVAETAWTQGRLVIVNEHFTDIKNKLERWYNVKIVFADEVVSKYSFTATFEKENIQQVLKALQYTFPFSYKMEEGRIIISK